MIQDKQISIRLPTEVHRWVNDFAAQWQVSKSYVLRAAIREFIKKKSA